MHKTRRKRDEDCESPRACWREQVTPLYSPKPTPNEIPPAIVDPKTTRAAAGNLQKTIISDTLKHLRNINIQHSSDFRCLIRCV